MSPAGRSPRGSRAISLGSVDYQQGAEQGQLTQQGGTVRDDGPVWRLVLERATKDGNVENVPAIERGKGDQGLSGEGSGT